MEPHPIDAEVVVLVEGPSDRAAVLAVAAVRDVPLAGVAVLSMGGATSVARHLTPLRERARPPVVLILCDEAEEPYVGRIVDRVWTRGGSDADADTGTVPRLFVCRPDLESELITAHGADRVLALIEEHGDGTRFRRLQHQPAQRERSVEAQLRRFFGSGSGRKIRYGEVLGQALASGAEPAALRQLITAIAATGHPPAR